MKESASYHIKNILAAAALIVIGVVGRMLLLDYPNVETLTAVSLLAGVLLGGIYAIAVPLLVVAITDMSIGIDLILLYTWSAWFLIGLFGLAARRFSRLARLRVFSFTAGMTGLGVLASLFFFVWTNFGVWQLFDYYPAGLDGLLASYIAGLPFLRLSLIGNLLLVPLISFFFVVGYHELPVWLKQRRIKSSEHNVSKL